ncbi:MAG: PIN domain-containing protein [Anaerolineae bacterium]|nr:PIN domain-containing protein [Anaerolineae bacterium]
MSDLTQRLQAVTRLLLDTAPVVYYVEENARYLPLVAGLFDRLDDGAFVGVISPVTLAECLVMPYCLDRPAVRQILVEVLSGGNTLFVPIDEAIADRAAELRAHYNLTLTDAFQIAAALAAGCEAFLTNDATLERVVELDVIVLDQIAGDE